MALSKEKTKGIPKLHKTRLLLYGPPKIGKTSLCSGFPGAYFAATEKGYISLKVFKTDIKNWGDFKKFIKDILEEEHEFKTVVIDTADKLFDKCSEYVCKKLGIEHESEADWGKGWAGVKKEFERTLDPLLQSNFGVIFLSHTKNDIITSDTKEISKMVPTLPNPARKILLPLLDSIGLMRYKRIKIKNKKGKVTGREEKLVISFKGTEEIEAGDRLGIFPPNVELETIPDERKSPELVEKFAKKNYERIARYYRR